jgi:hypothetical protein
MNVPVCTAAQVSAYDAGAAKHGDRLVTRIVVLNQSSKPCSVSGYPKLAFLFSNDAPESVTVRFTPTDANFSTPKPATTVLEPSQRASFLLGYPRADAHGNTCDAISSITVGGFRGGGTVYVPETISPCSTVNVSPYFTKPSKG